MKRYVAFIFLASLCCITFFSCSRDGKRALGAEFDRIDAYISLGQYRDAMSELKRIEKRLTNSWDFIGVYRRYNELGQTDRATEILKTAFEKHENNPEVRALYARILLRGGKIDEAIETSAPLQGSRYGSIYAEALLRQASSEVSYGNLSKYLTPEFFSIYKDAYTGSRDSYWLRNAAIVGMLAGDTESVRLLRPERYITFSDAFFWALIQYDNGNYGDAENALAQAQTLYESASNRERSKISPMQFTALYSDVYQALSENDRAEYVRQALLTGDSAVQENAGELYLPYIYVNSAEYALGNGDYDRASDLLTSTVTTWQDFVPGLISYANFAYQTAQSRSENVTQLALRESGVATREMKRYDSRARIPVADAIAKMDASLERKRDALLFIARLDLIYKTDATRSTENKIADLWNVLERNTIGINEYPQLLFEYAVNMLVRYNRVDDALSLFKRYCVSHYGFDAASDFWGQFYASKHAFTQREIEYAAWFAANQGLGTTSQKLYEACVWQEGGAVLRQDASVQACINLAMIYSSMGNRAAALELYSASAGRTPDVTQKAEIMYRMAMIYEANGNSGEALRTVATACALNPSHARAQLMYSRLSSR